MGNYTVIADAGKSIVSLLRHHMIPEPLIKTEDIGLCSPDEQGTAVLGIYLYNIEEVPEARNAEKIILDKEHFKNPPTSLYLYYMLFVKMESEIASRAIDEQRILGKAIEVLNDYGRLFGEEVEGTLKENEETLDIQGLVLPFEEKQKIYMMFEKKNFHGYFYKVGPVFIDSQRVRRIKRVTSGRFDVLQKGGGGRL